MRKRFFTALLSFLIILTLMPVAGMVAIADDPQVRLSISSNMGRAEPGDNVSVTVELDYISAALPGGGLFGLDFTLSYDERLTATSIDVDESGLSWAAAFRPTIASNPMGFFFEDMTFMGSRHTGILVTVNFIVDNDIDFEDVDFEEELSIEVTGIVATIQGGVTHAPSVSTTITLNEPTDPTGLTRVSPEEEAIDIERAEADGAFTPATVPLTVALTPDGAELGSFTIAWHSDDTTVATVAGDSLTATLTPVGAGEATITAQLMNGATSVGAAITWTVTVADWTAPTPEPEGLARIAPTQATLDMPVGGIGPFTVKPIGPAGFEMPDDWAIEWMFVNELSDDDETGGILERDGAGNSITVRAIGEVGDTVIVRARLLDADGDQVGEIVYWTVTLVPAHIPDGPGITWWPGFRPPTVTQQADGGLLITSYDGRLLGGDNVWLEVSDRDINAALGAGFLRLTAGGANNGIIRPATWTISVETLRRTAQRDSNFIFQLDSAAGTFHLPANIQAMVNNWATLAGGHTNLGIRVTIHRQNFRMDRELSPVTRFTMHLVDARGNVIGAITSWDGEIIKTVPVGNMPELWEARTGVRPTANAAIDWSRTFVPAWRDGGNVVIPAVSTTYIVVQEVRYGLRDTADHWSDDYVRAAFARRLVNGRTETTFEPDANVTRQEFAAMISRALRLVGADTTWPATYINAARTAGLTTFLHNTNMDMAGAITREEMAGILSRAATMAGLTGSGATIAFNDSDEIGGARIDDVQAVVALDLMIGHRGYFRPRDTLTRGEAATVLVRFVRSAEWMD
jgi:hypothetical protein